VQPDGSRHGWWWLFFGTWMLLNETRAVAVQGVMGRC